MKEKICEFAKRDIEIEYHNKRFGKKIKNSDKLFHALCLEIMQVGLSFYIVLLKENELLNSFYNFNIKKISNMSDEDINILLSNKKIIRNKLKIKAIINNAKIIIENNINFVDYVYNLDKNPKIALTKMKKDGFKYIGEINLKSFFEAVGVLNGHDKNCIKRGI